MLSARVKEPPQSKMLTLTGLGSGTTFAPPPTPVRSTSSTFGKRATTAGRGSGGGTAYNSGNWRNRAPDPPRRGSGSGMSGSGIPGWQSRMPSGKQIEGPLSVGAVDADAWRNYLDNYQSNAPEYSLDEIGNWASNLAQMFVEDDLAKNNLALADKIAQISGQKGALAAQVQAADASYNEQRARLNERLKNAPHDKNLLAELLRLDTEHQESLRVLLATEEAANKRQLPILAQKQRHADAAFRDRIEEIRAGKKGARREYESELRDYQNAQGTRGSLLSKRSREIQADMEAAFTDVSDEFTRLSAQARRDIKAASTQIAEAEAAVQDNFVVFEQKRGEIDRMKQKSILDYWAGIRRIDEDLAMGRISAQAAKDQRDAAAAGAAAQQSALDQQLHIAEQYAAIEEKRIQQEADGIAWGVATQVAEQQGVKGPKKGGSKKGGGGGWGTTIPGGGHPSGGNSQSHMNRPNPFNTQVNLTKSWAPVNNPLGIGDSEWGKIEGMIDRSKSPKAQFEQLAGLVDWYKKLQRNEQWGQYMQQWR